MVGYFALRWIVFVTLLFVSMTSSASDDGRPVRLGIVGLTHTHVHWIFESEQREDFEIVGIVEPNRALAERYSAQHGFDLAIVHDSMQVMFDTVRPDGVTACCCRSTGVVR